MPPTFIMTLILVVLEIEVRPVSLLAKHHITALFPALLSSNGRFLLSIKKYYTLSPCGYLDFQDTMNTNDNMNQCLWKNV